MFIKFNSHGDIMLSKIRKKKLESNIWKFYLYRLFCSLVFIGPIFVLFLRKNDLSMFQVMLLQSVYTIVIMLSVVPSGVIADYIGRKRVIIISSIFYSVGWFIYGAGSNFLQFVVAETIMGIAGGTWMASGNAFFYDTLKELDKEASYKRLFGNIVGIDNLVIGFGSLFGGYIAAYSDSFRLTFFLSGLMVSIGLLISFSFTATKQYKHADKHYFLHLKNASDFAARHTKVRMLIIYSALAMSIIFAVFIMIQPYLEMIKVPLVYFGWVYFAMNVLAAAGAKIAHKIEIYFGEKKIMIIMLVALIISIFGMARGILYLGAIFPISIFFISGIFQPVISDYLNKHIKSYHRSTVLSLQTLMTEGISAVSSPFFGWIVDFWSLKTAFIAAAVILIINLFILIGAFTMIRRKER